MSGSLTSAIIDRDPDFLIVDVDVVYTLSLIVA